jgi:preprotein translocase subunit SecG
MLLVVTIIHVLACVILVLVVLLQAGKGADMGAVFGGASSTIFGSSGAGNFLTRLTTGAAVVFMATSLMLTYGSVRGTTSTIMPESVAPPVADLPAGDAADGTEAGGADVAGGAQPEAAPDAAPGGEGEAQPAGEDQPAPAPEAPAAAPPEKAPPVAP